MTIMWAILDVQYSAPPVLQPPALESLVLSSVLTSVLIFFCHCRITRLSVNRRHFVSSRSCFKVQKRVAISVKIRLHFFRSSEIIFVEIQSFHPGGTLCGCYCNQMQFRKFAQINFLSTHYSNYVSVSYKRDFMTLSINELTKKSCKMISAQV